jgi:hypothetical protein
LTEEIGEGAYAQGDFAIESSLGNLSDMTGVSGMTSLFAGIDTQYPEADSLMTDPCPRFEGERELHQAQIEAMDEELLRTQELETFKAKYYIDLDLTASGSVHAEAPIIENSSN